LNPKGHNYVSVPL